MPADTSDPYAQVNVEGLYRDLAADLPNKVGIGGALITMVEPDPGHEADYNRWYEDDHFYAGATIGPWMFAGRRWVAPRRLQELRFPADSPIAQPVTKGCYISTYMILEGHFQDIAEWSVVLMRDYLKPYGRGFDHREHIYTSFSSYEFGVVRPDLPFLQPFHVLDHPFAGLVVEVVDTGSAPSRQAVLDDLEKVLIPGDLTGTPAAAVLGFTPSGVHRGDIPEGRYLTLLWFVQADPSGNWDQFRAHTELVGRTGAKLIFAAPFIPTVPGTDTYVDQLR